MGGLLMERTTVRKKKGIALISVLLVLVIMFIISTGFIQLIARDAQIGVGQYQSNVSLMLADSGIEYGLFLIRHNCFNYSSNYIIENVVISELTYPVTTSPTSAADAYWLKAQGRFVLYEETGTTSNTSIKLQSEGQIVRGDGSLLYKRTAFAVVKVGDTGSGDMRVTSWYENWR